MGRAAIRLQTIFRESYHWFAARLRTAWTLFVRPVRAVERLVLSGLHRVAATLTRIFFALFRLILSALARCWQLAQWLLSPLVTLIIYLGRISSRWFRRIEKWALSLLRLIVGVLRRLVRPILIVIEHIISVVTTIVRRIAAFLGRIIHTIVRVIEHIISVITTIVRRIAGFFTSIARAVDRVLRRIWNLVAAPFREVVRAAREAIRFAFNLVLRFARGGRGLWRDAIGLSRRLLRFIGRWLWKPFRWVFRRSRRLARRGHGVVLRFVRSLTTPARAWSARVRTRVRTSATHVRATTREVIQRVRTRRRR